MKTSNRTSRTTTMVRNDVDGSPEERIAYMPGSELGQRVASLEVGMQSIKDTLSSIITKLDSKSETKWGLLVSIGMLSVIVLSSLGALAYWPIMSNTTRMEQVMLKLAERQEQGDRELRDRMVPRSEYDRELVRNRQSIDRLVSRIDRLEFGRPLNKGTQNGS